VNFEYEFINFSELFKEDQGAHMVNTESIDYSNYGCTDSSSCKQFSRLRVM